MANQPMRVLVTAAGSGPGVAIVKALKRPEIGAGHVHAVDMSAHAAGLYLADTWSLVPHASAPGYVEELLSLCDRHGLSMVIPIFDTETPVLSQKAAAFEARGIHVAVNPHEAIVRANDKRACYEVCAAAQIAQPPIVADPDSPDGYPILGKRVQGVGSKDMLLLRSDADQPRGGLPKEGFLWQRYVEGDEFTVDTFGDPAGDFVAVPRLRKVVKAGQSVQGVTVDDPALVSFARRTCAAFAVKDVSCVQVIRDDAGDLWFIEINPRYGTGISLSIAAGVPFPLLQWLSKAAPHQITPEMRKPRAGVTMIRYWEEIYI
jgi:carbamoyl-phosphate synthase large subunit